MISLVANENKKILKSKLVFGFLLSGALLIWLNIIMYDPKLCDWKTDSLYTFPKGLVEIYIQILMFYIPIFVSSLVTKDLVDGTLKLSLIREPSRIKNLIAKQISFIIFLEIGTLAFILMCYILAFIYYKNMIGLPLIRVNILTDITSTFILYGMTILPSFAYGLFTMLLGIIFKNAVIANLVSITGLIFLFNTEIGMKFTMIDSLTRSESIGLSLILLFISVMLIVINNIYLEKQDITY